MSQAAFNNMILFTRKLNLNWRKKLIRFYIWSIALCDGDNVTLLEVGQKYLKILRMMLAKEGEDYFDQSYESLRSMT
jgi:hypothetical protein